MLTYLINVTNDLLALSVILGVICAFVDHFFKDRGKQIFRICLLLGFLIAGVRAYITNTRRLVGGWKVGVYGYAAGLVLFVLVIAAFAVLGRRFFRQQPGTRKESVPGVILAVLIGLLTIAYLFGALPNVYIYPFKFDTGGNGYLSTDYLFRLGGYLLGILVSICSWLSAFKISTVVAQKGYGKLLCAAFFALNAMYAVYNFARLMLVLTPRKIVDSIALFNFASSSNNKAEWYTYAAFFVILVMGALIWVRSHTAREPYDTPAEHRKQRALWRTGKRYTVLALLCLLCGILCATWFVKLNTEVIREAPVEECIVKNDGSGEPENLLVSLDAVKDGHLHRFGYTTDEGKLVRFIVVLKQENTNNYGVGLDACEICGEAGYYENSDGQIVCKKCGVVMNTTTIGMKGGCNPIIIDYDINDGYIIVPVSEMVNNQGHFSS